MNDHDKKPIKTLISSNETELVWFQIVFVFSIVESLQSSLKVGQ